MRSVEHPRRWRPAVAWLLVVAAGCVLGVAGVHELFVHTWRGQQVDGAALRGAGIGRARIISEVRHVLDLVSVLALAAATATVGFIAVLRRRPGVALLVVLLIAGANLTTQVLKFAILSRPDLGNSGPAHNTLPSGHTTVAMSVAVALVLVVPPAVRGLAAVVGAAFAAVMGVATLSAGWHRPSDAVAACLVVGGWAAVLGAGAAAVTPAPATGIGSPRDAHPLATSLLGVGALVCLAFGVTALLLTAGAVPADLSRLRLFVAYAGGAATIAGTALAVMSALLVVVHRIVPALPRQPGDRPPAATPARRAPDAVRR